MKYFTQIAIAALAGLASAEQMFDLREETATLVHSDIYRSHFGYVVEEFVFETHTQKNITLPEKKFMADYEQQAAHLDWAVDYLERQKQSDAEPVYTCDKHWDPKGAFDFLPVLVADLRPTSPTGSYSEGTCFGSMDLSFEITSESTFDVTMTLGDKKSPLCHEYLAFANTEFWHLEVFYMAGTHKLTFNMPTVEEQEDVGYGGVMVYLTCDGVLDETVSVLRTMAMFIDIQDDTNLTVPDYMIDANLRFLSNVMDYNMESRPIQNVDIDESLIKSGDFFGVVRLDGTSPMIMYGTGGRFSHCTSAVWFEDGLHIVESQGAGYWPINGIQRTPFAEWIQMARARDYNVVWLPLKDEVAAKYDVQKARDFFFELEGTPYGYHNFLYGWIDTYRSNLPPLMPMDMVPIILSQYEKIKPETVYRIFTAGLNKRMGTDNLDIAQVVGLAATQQKTIQDLMMEVEVEGWEYYDGKSYVCSAFVAGIWQAAGIFGDAKINATEFQPYDDYRLNFFDKNFERPQACVDADPDLPYCQLMGKYRIQLQLDQYSSLEPYSNMYESCASTWPEYAHAPEGC